MEQKRLSNIILENRKKISLSGIVDVLNFDDETIILSSDLGTLVIKGEKLHIVSFDSMGGDLIAQGEVAAVVYKDDSVKENFLKKVLK